MIARGSAGALGVAVALGAAFGPLGGLGGLAGLVEGGGASASTGGAASYASGRPALGWVETGSGAVQGAIVREGGGVVLLDVSEVGLELYLVAIDGETPWPFDRLEAAERFFDQLAGSA